MGRSVTTLGTNWPFLLQIAAFCSLLSVSQASTHPIKLLFQSFSVCSFVPFLLSVPAYKLQVVPFPSPMLATQPSPMDSVSLLGPSLDFNKEKNHNGGVLFDSSLLQRQAKIPKQFIWPQAERPSTLEELEAPVVDLEGFFKGDQVSTQRAVRLIRDACSTHGFFQVINHGISASLCRDAFDFTDSFFKLPAERKLRARRRPGSTWGYAGAHTDRFSSRLPWKETLSFGYNEADSESVLAEYFVSVVGMDFEKIGYKEHIHEIYVTSSFRIL